MLHHPCILGDPQRKGDKIRIGCLTPAFWEAHKWAECYITPAFSGVPKERGTKSELVGPTSGQKCYITPAFSGVPNKGDKIKVGPQVGGIATSPLHSRGPQSKGNKIRIGCLTRAFREAHKWAEMLHHPCILGDPQ